MEEGRSIEHCSCLSLSPGQFPTAFCEGISSTNLVSVLYDNGPDEWRRKWRTEFGREPRREAMIDVSDMTRGAAATSQPIPRRDIALTTLERPLSGETLVETVESYLLNPGPADTMVYVDDLGALAEDVGRSELVAVVADLVDVVERIDGRLVLDVGEVGLPKPLVDQLREAVDVVHCVVDDDLEHAVSQLQDRDPTNYGYARRHWREACEGIEGCNRNYPQSKQIHESIAEPETTPRTLGATLQALVDLGVIDTWSETVGSTRYDLTAYDADRLAEVGVVLDASW